MLEHSIDNSNMTCGIVYIVATKISHSWQREDSRFWQTSYIIAIQTNGSCVVLCLERI